jgi:hypothetical protein
MKKRDSVTAEGCHPTARDVRHTSDATGGATLGAVQSLTFRCPRCDRMGVRAQGVVAPICEACRKAWGGK